MTVWRLFNTDLEQLHFTNKPLEVHNYGFTFNDNFTYLGFSTKIEQVREKNHNQVENISSVLVTPLSDARFPQ